VLGVQLKALSIPGVVVPEGADDWSRAVVTKNLLTEPGAACGNPCAGWHKKTYCLNSG